MLARSTSRLLLAVLLVASFGAAAPVARALKSPCDPTVDATGDNAKVVFCPSIYFPGLEQLDPDWRTQGVVVNGDTLARYVVELYKFLTAATAILALFMVTYGGLLWLLAGGNQGAIGHAKEVITGAVAGMLVALLSYALLASVSRGLVSFRSLDTNVPASSGSSGSYDDESMSEETRTFFNVSDIPAVVAAGTYDAALAAAAARHDMSCTWLKATLIAESRGDSNAQSSAGACGLLQVKPATANDLLRRGLIDPPRPGPATIMCDDLKDPAYGIEVGAAFMAQLWHSGNYQTDYAYCTRPAVHTTLKPQETWSLQDKIAGYNGGVGGNCLSNTCPGDTFWHCPANAGYAETREYVPKVQAYFELLRSQGLACD